MKPAGWAAPWTPRPAKPGQDPPGLHIGNRSLPLALRSKKTGVPSVESLESYKLQLAGTEAEKQAERGALNKLAAMERRGDDPLLGFISRTTLSAYESSGRLEQLAKKGQGGPKYPNYGLAKRLELIAQIIKADFGTRIFYTSLDGFDTHANQLGTHAALLLELSDSIAAFHDDLAAAGQGDRVALLTFSEFGRRVLENASGGTDHGAAAPLFLVGPVATAGLGRCASELRRSRRRRPEVPHRFPPGLREPGRRLARLRRRADRRQRVFAAAVLAAWVNGTRCCLGSSIRGLYSVQPALKGLSAARGMASSPMELAVAAGRRSRGQVQGILRYCNLPRSLRDTAMRVIRLKIRTTMGIVAILAVTCAAVEMQRRSQAFRLKARYHLAASHQLEMECQSFLCGYGMPNERVAEITSKRAEEQSLLMAASAYHRALDQKYQVAAANPWLPVAADPRSATQRESCDCHGRRLLTRAACGRRLLFTRRSHANNTVHLRATAAAPLRWARRARA